jgi:hypothetical protein
MSEYKDLSGHILPNSANLVGVCITVISLVKALHIGHVGSLLDSLLAVDALFFTVSAFLSYASLRGIKSVIFEKFADHIFMMGLLELGICAILLSFEVI